MNIGEYTIYNSNLDIDRIQIHEAYKTLVANIWKIQLEFNEQIFFFLPLFCIQPSPTFSVTTDWN